MLTPDGAPINEYTIGKVPEDVTWNVPPGPVTTLVLPGLVIFGGTGAGATVRVKLCSAFGSVPLLTITVKEYGGPAATLPGIAMLPFVLSIVTPDGAPVNE